MKLAVIILSVLTALCALGWVYLFMNVSHAEDNWNVVPFVLGTALFGFIDLVLIIVWLAVT